MILNYILNDVLISKNLLKVYEGYEECLDTEINEKDILNVGIYIPHKHNKNYKYIRNIKTKFIQWHQIIF